MKKFVGFEKGVNLGGWLSQGTYDKKHLDSFISEDDFRIISGGGADHVRIPVDYNILETEDGKIIESGFEYIQKAIDLCEENNLNMILDLHKTIGFSFHPGHNEKGFFEGKALQERFYTLWERLARRFGKYSENVAFELLNEVTNKEYSDEWNRISTTAIKRIRRHAPKIKILLGSYWNNSVDALADLAPPYDENVIYNFHCYDPFLFTHQAAHWLDNMPDELRISYPGNISDYRRTMKELGLDYIQDYLDVPDSGFDTAYFEKRFQNAVRICEERGTALYCGEYGVINTSEPEDALKWFKDIHSAFEKLGISRAAWSYKNVDFGLSDEHMKSVIDEIITLL